MQHCISKSSWIQIVLLIPFAWISISTCLTRNESKLFKSLLLIRFQILRYWIWRGDQHRSRWCCLYTWSSNTSTRLFQSRTWSWQGILYWLSGDSNKFGKINWWIRRRFWKWVSFSRTTISRFFHWGTYTRIHRYVKEMHKN